MKTYSGSSGVSVMRKTQWRGLRCMDMARRRRVCGYKAMEFAAAINVPAWWVRGEICIGACLGWAKIEGAFGVAWISGAQQLIARVQWLLL